MVVTPTQESATWTPSWPPANPTDDSPTWTPEPNKSISELVDCLNMELDPVIWRFSPNPCLDNPVTGVNGWIQPFGFSTVYIENPQSTYHRQPEIVYDNGYRIDVTGLAGRVGYRLPVMELERGRCYLLKIVADVNLAFNEYYVARQSFHFGATAHRDDGVYVDLNKQSFEFEMFTEDELPFVWGVYSNADNPVITIDVWFESVWAIALHGSSITFHEIGLYGVRDNGYCANAPGV